MYTLADLEFNNIASNYASSVRVPYGLTLELYDHDGFSGTKKTVTGSMFIDTVSQEFPCVNINGDFGFDNMASSAIVFGSELGGAYGYWESITSSEEITYMTHYGFTTSKSESKSVSEQAALSLEMHEKLSMLVEEDDLTINESFSFGI